MSSTDWMSSTDAWGRIRLGSVVGLTWPIGFALGLAVAAAAIAAPCFDVAMVAASGGPPCGPLYTQAEAISAAGEVVGRRSICGLSYGWFRWTAENGYQAMPTPAGTVEPWAVDANADGDVIGNLEILSPSATGAFLRRDGVSTVIAPPPGVWDLQVSSINENGVIAGYWLNPDPSIPFLWQDGRFQPIELDIKWLYAAHAYDLNDANVVVGIATGFLDPELGYVWDAGRVTLLEPLPGGLRSRAIAINNHNAVAAYSLHPNPSGDTALACKAFLWQDGVITEIAPLPTFEFRTIPTDINDNGWVVGYGERESGLQRGFLWIDGVTHDLDSFVPPEVPEVMRKATGINEQGQIVGYGYYTLVMTPRPPQPADLSGDCRVDGLDLSILLGFWGPVRGSGKGDTTPAAAADLDGNGMVNGHDLAILLGAWG
jgi:probable HAF family extracellular repeat protein